MSDGLYLIYYFFLITVSIFPSIAEMSQSYKDSVDDYEYFTDPDPDPGDKDDLEYVPSEK